jgi:hypothetical protein
LSAVLTFDFELGLGAGFWSKRTFLVIPAFFEGGDELTTAVTLFVADRFGGGVAEDRSTFACRSWLSFTSVRLPEMLRADWDDCGRCLTAGRTAGFGAGVGSAAWMLELSTAQQKRKIA